MKAFLGCYGKPHVPAYRRAELSDRMLTVFTQGGLMHTVDSDKGITLLRPPKFNDLNNLYVNYDYLKDEPFDIAGFEADRSLLFCGPACSSLSIYAAYLLLEFYSDQPVIARMGEYILFGTPPIGWLNYLFDESWANTRSQNLWQIYKLLPPHQRDLRFDYFISKEDLKASSVPGLLTYLCVGHPGSLEETIVKVMENSSAAASIRDSLTAIRQLAGKLIEAHASTEDTASLLVRIKAFLSNERSVALRLAENYSEMSIIILLHALPWEIGARLIAEVFHLDFWELHDELAPVLKHRQPQYDDEFYRGKIPEFQPIPPHPTEKFFNCTGDDRAFYWTSDGNVEFSAKMRQWVAELSSELDRLLLSGKDLIEPSQFFFTFRDTLKKADAMYHRLYCFEDTFYEFLRESKNRKFQAAVVLLQNMIEQYQEETKFYPPDWTAKHLKLSGRMKIKRYLAILANPQLRRSVLGF